MLQLASRIVVIVISVLAVTLIGDYLGYKVGRRRLALIVAALALVTVVIFTIYAVVNQSF